MSLFSSIIKKRFYIYLALFLVFSILLYSFSSNISPLSKKKKVYIINIDDIISYDRFQIDALYNFILTSDADGYLFIVDSLGGSVQASYKIASAIRKTNKTSVCYIRRYGTSGAYWIASQCDYIISEPFAIVGSVGVTMSYLEFSGLLNKLGIDYERLIAGKYKDIGSPYRDLSKEEREILESKLNIIYNFFVDQVMSKRNVSRDILNGEFYLGVEARNNGLVDSIGDLEDAKLKIATLMRVKENDIYFIEKDFSRKDSLLSYLVGEVLSSFLPISSSCTFISLS